MHHPIKTATCCYCGAKTMLELRGKSRHELACAQCGAPLRRMKMLPTGPMAGTAPAATPTRPGPQNAHRNPRAKSPPKQKKKKKNKGLRYKIWSEIWDVVEDILD